MTSWLHVGNGTPYILHAHAHSRLSSQDECRDLACEVFSVSRWLGPLHVFPRLQPQVRPLGGYIGLGKKRKGKKNPRSRHWFYQVAVFVDSRIKVTREDVQFHGWGISKFANIRVKLFCEHGWKVNSIIVYLKSISVTLGRIHRIQMVACRLTNSLSHQLWVVVFFSSSFWIAPPNWTHARAPVSKNGLCLSKASSVNKQNKRDDGWLLGPHLISANVQLFKVSCASLICFKAEEK